MERSNKIDLDQLLDNWEKEITFSQSFTKSDISELKTHLLDIYDELQEKGLSEQEVFLIAMTRIGKSVNWESEFKETNAEVLNLKRIVNFFAGILIYLFSYYGILAIAKGIFIVGNEISPESLRIMQVCRIFLIVMAIFMLQLVVRLLFEDYNLFRFIDKIRFRPVHAFIAFASTICFVVANHYSMYLLKDTVTSINFMELLRYFDYFFLLILTFGFIILYIKFYKKEFPITKD